MRLLLGFLTFFNLLLEAGLDVGSWMIAVMFLTPLCSTSQFEMIEFLSYSSQAFTSSAAALVFAVFRRFPVGVQLRVP